MDRVELLRYSQYATKLLIFTSLMVLCYYLYMDEAIRKSQSKATTVTSRDLDHQGKNIFTAHFNKNIYRAINCSRTLMVL